MQFAWAWEEALHVPPCREEALGLRLRLFHRKSASFVGSTAVEPMKSDANHAAELLPSTIGEKDDYDSENSLISDGLPSNSRRRRRGEGRGEGGEWREK